MRTKIILILLMLSPLLRAKPLNKGLIIVTTQRIVDSSSKLAEFIAEKESHGFSVLVATEADFGGAQVKGQAKAILIRQWLQASPIHFSHADTD